MTTGRIRLGAAGAALAVGLMLSGTESHGQRASCAAAPETINWTREKLARPDVTTVEVRRILAHLELSTRNCATNGDLWYYRSVVERRLGEPAASVDYSVRKAREWRSEALSRQGEAPPPAAPAAPAAPPVTGAVANKWALVVGVNEFVDSKIRTLNYAAKDARDFHSALTDPEAGRFAPSKVRLLVDSAATLGAVRSGIGWLRTNAGPSDLVVVYMASHGSPRDFDPLGVSYVLLHDTDSANAERMYASALQMIDLVDDLTRDLKAGRVVLVLDTCFSGDATRLRMARGLTLFAPALSGFSGVGGRVVIAAASGDQPSFESPQRQNGYFTYFLVDALRRSKGQWPLRRLFDDVQQNVSTTVQRELSTSQTPVMSSTADIEAMLLGAAEGTDIAARRLPSDVLSSR